MTALTGQKVIVHSESRQFSASTQPDTTSRTGTEPWIIVLVVVLIAFSALCRLSQLNRNVFWTDEEFTSGLTSPRLNVDPAWFGKPIAAGAWRQMERVERSAPMRQVLHNVRWKEIPDQAPAYYVATRFWTQMCGDSLGNWRLLSVIFSFLALPLVFALANEFFRSRTVSWLSLAIVAVSPFNLVYGQLARPYSMWLCTVLLSWLMLAKAHRREKLTDWLLLGICYASSLLTHYASLPMIAASYLASLARRRFTIIMGLVIATIVSILLLSPWLTYAGFGFLKSGSDSWLSSHLTASKYISAFLEDARKIVVDLPIPAEKLNMRLIDGSFLLLYVSALVIAYKQTTAAGRVVLQSAVIYLLLLAAIDITSGGIRLTVMRYLTPAIAVVQICLANYVVTRLQKKRSIGILLLALILVSGVLSCFFIATSELWWLQRQRDCPPSVVSLLNEKDHPLWITEWVGRVLYMSRLVDSHVLLEVATPERYSIPAGLNEVFVFDRKNTLLTAICRDGHWDARQIKIRTELSPRVPILTCQTLWQLSRHMDSSSHSAYSAHQYRPDLDGLFSK